MHDRDLVDEKETERIRGRLDGGEVVVMSARQSRVKPGGASIVNPNTIFLTDRRVIIRSPVSMGLGEHIEEYFYSQITNVRLEKGMLSASLVFHIPGMTELSKHDRKRIGWGRNSEGAIDAIPKEAAERMYDYIRSRIDEARERAASAAADDPLRILKARYARGEITREEFEEMRRAVE